MPPPMSYWKEAQAGYGPYGRFFKPSDLRSSFAAAPVRRRRVGARSYGTYDKMQRAIANCLDPGALDTAFSAAVINTTGAVTLLNGIAEGDGQNERTGRKLALKSVQVRGFVSPNSAAETQEGVLLLVYDKSPKQADLVITDLLVSVNARSLPNSEEEGRFKVLWRQHFQINAVAGVSTGDGNFTHVIEYYRKLSKKNLETRFRGASTGVIGNIEVGALWLVLVGSLAAGTTASNFTGSIRVRFCDLH